jgi:hypothetical protein
MTIEKHSPLFDSTQALLEVTKHLSIPPQRKSLRTIGTRNFVILDELDKARLAWKRLQSTRRRDAIYCYLSEVFVAVRRWKQQDCVEAKMRQALKGAGTLSAIRNREPFAVAIFCSSDPSKADGKTRSKWSRVLRYAERSKPNSQSLVEFVKSRGGLNECARRFARNRKTRL